MLLFKNKTELNNFSDSSRLEWLETNGLGGWASSSLCGCNTRRYHGLLMAAVVPPAERMLLVSKLDETVFINGEKFELGCNDFGDVISPGGFQWLSSFKKEFFPEWLFDFGEIRLRKTIMMIYGENTTLIRYEVLNAPGNFILQLLPLIAARGYHQLKQASSNIFWKVDFENGIFHNQPFDGAPDIFISVPGSNFRPTNEWYYRFNYVLEKNRGLDFKEDLFNHGLFSVELKSGVVLDIIISMDNPKGKNSNALFEAEMSRRLHFLKGVPGDLPRVLCQAADQFIVQRELPGEAPQTPLAHLKTVIAGYHWFTDWGRDTMISLPGLCLQTGRFEDAKKIIAIFAKSVNMGMLPNRFQDNKEPPEYNNVDGTLWYFNAVYAYLQMTNDRSFILDEILPILKNIMEWHFKGTRFQIRVDSDGLLHAGESGQQLTWMDARVNGWVVTPRMGKPVEIQALWYNALKIFETILLQNGESAAADIILARAEQANKSFGEKFWFEEGNYLYDLLDEQGMPDTSIRPNQLFAISLPFPLIENKKAEAVINCIRNKLYTPYGLRSLSPDDPAYNGHYVGNAFQRDSVYHQGTVWSWLLGPYVEAGMKTLGDVFRPEAIAVIDRFSLHLNDVCIGSISEIFDGDTPHAARGCVAQAWSVGEILRVVKVYGLFQPVAKGMQ